MTDLANFESQLDESKQRLDFVLNSNRIGTWEFDVDSKLLFCDEQMYAIFDCKRAEFPNPQDAWSFVTTQCEQQRSREYLDAAISEHEEMDYISQLSLPNGEKKACSTQGAAL